MNYFALPQVPMHKPEECAAAQELAHNVRELNQPFQVLQMLQLKTKVPLRRIK